MQTLWRNFIGRILFGLLLPLGALVLSVGLIAVASSNQKHLSLITLKPNPVSLPKGLADCQVYTIETDAGEMPVVKCPSLPKTSAQVCSQIHLVTAEGASLVERCPSFVTSRMEP